MEIYRFILSLWVVIKALFTHLTKALSNTEWKAEYFKGGLDLQFHKHFLEAEIISLFELNLRKWSQRAKVLDI